MIIFDIVKNFEKQYKYTLWDKMKNQVIELFSSIYKANSSFDDRFKNIKKSREQVEVLRIYTRLCKDLKTINIKKYADISLKIESLSKQLFAWEKSTKNK